MNDGTLLPLEFHPTISLLGGAPLVSTPSHLPACLLPPWHGMTLLKEHQNP